MIHWRRDTLLAKIRKHLRTDFCRANATHATHYLAFIDDEYKTWDGYYCSSYAECLQLAGPLYHTIVIYNLQPDIKLIPHNPNNIRRYK